MADQSSKPASPGEPTSPSDPWPVRVVSQKINSWIARLGKVWVDGQISQISQRPGSNLIFLTLRDPSADISLQVTTWRDTFEATEPKLTEGARVITYAKPEFFPGRGTLALRAEEFRHVGIGELLARLEKLKKLLAAEGLFDPRRKRKLPFLPHTIGLVTGRASAAERDVITNAQRRWPAINFTQRNVAVQGPTAANQIITALQELDRDPQTEVIVLARGGGSVEDLLPFSDEALCRAVFACLTPIVSAVGHETDSPLVDFVADVRASTPTDAAKRIVPDFAEEQRATTRERARLARAITHRLDREQHRLDALRTRPALTKPQTWVDSRADDVQRLKTRSQRTIGHQLEQAATELTHTLARLRALSPAATLERGYAVVQTADNAVLRDATNAVQGDTLRIRLATGEVQARVAER